MWEEMVIDCKKKEVRSFMARGLSLALDSTCLASRSVSNLTSFYNPVHMSTRGTRLMVVIFVSFSWYQNFRKRPHCGPTHSPLQGAGELSSPEYCIHSCLVMPPTILHGVLPSEALLSMGFESISSISMSPGPNLLPRCFRPAPPRYPPCIRPIPFLRLLHVRQGWVYARNMSPKGLRVDPRDG